MPRTETITISLAEYKQLLSRELPQERDRLLLDSILDSMLDYAELIEYDSYSSDFKGLKFSYKERIVKDIMNTIFTLDRPRFIDFYKRAAKKKRESNIQALNIQLMNDVKELKNE